MQLATGERAASEKCSLAEFIAEVQASASLEATARDCRLAVSAVDPSLAIDVDRNLLLAAMANLLQNAFKFTRSQTQVSVSAYAAADRVRIDVTDACGGLPAGATDKMFIPFTQFGEDKSGLGLGLSIARESVMANGGTLSVRDVPGSGCVFSIDLPRHLI